MTKWIWPKYVNMTKNWQQQKLTWWTWPKFKIKFATMTNMPGWIWPKMENPIKIATTTNMSGWIWPKIENTIFRSNSISYFHSCGIIFYIFYFRSNSIVFGWVQQVNARCCHFSVMFKKLWFVSLGHIQTDFWSYWFGQVI